ncbi:MAG: ATP synthase F1 subunit delta [Bdellovibrionales bacterium]|nr:ATP synthase F1 subunit delta [Bdellovibrionales bacterium]
MRYSEVAARYATALFDLATEDNKQDQYYSDLLALNKVFVEDQPVYQFITNPLTKSTDKESAIAKALESQTLSLAVKSFVLLLARKNRLGAYSEIMAAFQAKNDEAHGVTRGSVESAAVLNPDERAEVERFVSKATGKRVILAYKENSDLIGGLIARVGSYTFDDTLTSHLHRLKDELKRRAH